MVERSSKNNPDRDRSWLQRLQQDSWELELLISGILLFGIIQGLKYATEFHESFVRNHEKLDAWYLFELSIYSLEQVGKVLALFLVFHLLVRALWVGALGVSSIYTSDIRFERLKVSGYVEEKLRRQLPSQLEFAVTLDKVASITFALCFLVTAHVLVLHGIVFSLAMTAVGAFWLETEMGLEWVKRILRPSLGLVVLYVLLVLLAWLANLLSLGKIVKSERLSRYYYFLLQPIRWVTLARFYRPVYYVLITNQNRLFVNALIGFSIAAFVAPMFTSWEAKQGQILISPRSGTFTPYAYDNLRPSEAPIRRMSIDTDRVQGDALRLFVVLGKKDWDRASRNCPEMAEYEKSDIHEKYSADLNLSGVADCLAAPLEVFVDGEPAEGLKFHLSKQVGSRVFGLLTYVPLPEAASGGWRELKMRRKTLGSTAGDEEGKPSSEWVGAIPFWHGKAAP